MLLVLSDPELEHQVFALETKLRQLDTQLRQATSIGDRQKAEQIKAKKQGLIAQYDRAKYNKEKLTIKSPIDGVLQIQTEMKLENLNGSFLPLRSSLFAVYEPGLFEAVAAVNHRDIGQVNAGQKVELKLWSFDDEVLESVVDRKPETPVREMSSAAFSTVFHGEVQTMPAAEAKEALVPAENTYELEISLAEDLRLLDGMVGRAKIIIEEKTLGQAFYWWVMQTLRQDIRL